MRSQYLFLSTLLAIVVLFSLPVNGTISLFGDHMSPKDAQTDDSIEIFIMVKDTENTGIGSVNCLINNLSINMEPYSTYENESLNWSVGVLYWCSWTVEEGNHELSFEVVDTSGNRTTIGPEILHYDISEEKKEDTIFGLPKTYCAISVIFITLIIIFLTWSYFKGRKMQKQVVDETGSSMMACSACGTHISITDEKCPKCGASFDDEEHVCGSCGEVISPDDTRCSKCGSKLRSAKDSYKDPQVNKKDLDLLKLKNKKINMKGKIKCSNCGSVYMKKEKECPECHEE